MSEITDATSGATSDRRRFLKAALAGGVAAAGATTALAQGKPAAATAPVANPANQPPKVADWSKVLGDGVTDHPYGQPIKFESHVVRKTVEWLTAERASSINFTPLAALDGIITPNGLCFERHHSGAAEVNPVDYRLMLHGLVDKPLVFSLEDLQRFPRVNKIHFLECAANSGMEWRGAPLNGCQFTHGMIHNVMYTGVYLKHLLNEAGVKPTAKWLLVEGGDAAGMNRSLPLEKALEDTIVAYILFMNDVIKDQKFELNQQNFASIRLPNADGFYDDDRETTEKHFWNRQVCMKDCRPEAKVTGRAAVLDVTPDGKSGPKVD